MNFDGCVLNFIFFICSLVVTMEIHYYSYMVIMGRRGFWSLRYDLFSMCHFGLFLLIVNLVMSTLPKFTQSMC